MAEYTNFTKLQTDVRNYIERGFTQTSDPTVYEQIPRLINLAERKLADKLKLLGQIEVLSDPTGLQASNSILIKPDRWRSTVSLYYRSTSGGNAVPLLPRSFEYCQTYWPDPTLTAAPEFYADITLQRYLIAPTPDQAYALMGRFYMLPVLLDATNQTNFWTDYTPNLLLYGTLLEATPFLKDDSRIPIWQGFYQDQIADLGGQDLQREMDHAAERTGV